MNRIFRKLSLLLALILLAAPCSMAEESTENNWYLETAAVLHDKLNELISCDGFDTYYTSQEDVLSLIASWETELETQPLSVKGYDLPPAELISEIMPDMESLPAAMQEKIERSLASMLISQINAAEGVSFLAASSIPVFSEGYVMPDGFAPCIILYEYGNICVSVSFTGIGEDVVMATAQFVSPKIVDLLTPQ